MNKWRYSVGLAIGSLSSVVSTASAQCTDIEHLPVTTTGASQMRIPAPLDTIPRDTVRGEIVNYETLLARPVMVTADGARVLVANEPDNRLVVFSADLSTVIAEVPLGQGISAIAERPMSTEIWVTLRHQAATAVVDRTTWRVTHLLRPYVDPTIVGTRYADVPSGIAFNADGSKAYVSSTTTDHLVVFDAVNKQPAATPLIPLEHCHFGHLTSMSEPFGIVRSGDLLYVSSFRSGNQTLVRKDATPGLPAPHERNFDLDGADASFGSLPDFDVLVVDTTTDSVSSAIRGVGTLLAGMAVVPSTGKLAIANMEARNDEFIGERSFPQGRVVFNRLTFADITPPLNLVHQFVSTDNLTNAPVDQPWVNVAQPTGVAVDSGGNVYVAGYASSNIGVFTSTGAFLATIPTLSGPYGLAYSAASDSLYCYHRGAATVSRFDLTAGIPSGATASASLIDPTYDNVAAGRRIFVDASHSEKGTTTCGSCHIEGRTDLEGWDLSKYHDDGDSFSLANPPTGFEDRKGIMQTQDLRSIEESVPYHWRGEQKDLIDFNSAFVDLLKGTELSQAEFDDFQAYVFSLRYPSNPFQCLDRGTSQRAFDGFLLYSNKAFVPDSVSCNACHALPSTTDGSISDPLGAGNELPGLNVDTAQLRGLWEKLSDISHVSNANAGFFNMLGDGFSHSGTDIAIEAFLKRVFPDMEPQEESDVAGFMHELDSGIAPAANWSELLGPTNPNGASFLISQAEAGNCDLAAHAWFPSGPGYSRTGLVYDPVQDLFLLDDGVSTVSPATLSAAAASGVNVLLLGTPVGSGQRLGVDRDRDGLFDAAEISQGTNPADPDSDGDGFWDGFDSNPTGFGGGPTAPVTAQDITVEWATTNAVKVTYTTDAPSPTIVDYGLSGGPLDRTTGDALPMPAASNLWKRHHTAFLRLLEDGRTYDFAVRTRSQTGQEQIFGVFSTAVPDDPVPPGIDAVLVSEVELTQPSPGLFHLRVRSRTGMEQPRPAGRCMRPWP